jgi:hypothetical protein
MRGPRRRRSGPWAGAPVPPPTPAGIGTEGSNARERRGCTKLMPNSVARIVTPPQRPVRRCQVEWVAQPCRGNNASARVAIPPKEPPSLSRNGPEHNPRSAGQHVARARDMTEHRSRDGLGSLRMSSTQRGSPAGAPAFPRPMPLTSPGTGAAGLSPSKRGAAAGVTSRRTLGRKAPAPRVPTKAQEAVDRLLDKIRTRADQTPLPAGEAVRGEEKRDGNGHFSTGTRPGPGRPPGSRNKVSRSIKEVLRDLGEGIINVTYKDAATGKLVEGPVAHLLGEQLAAGLMDPKHYTAFVKMLFKYSLSQPETEVDPKNRRRPEIVFLHETRKAVVPAPENQSPGTSSRENVSLGGKSHSAIR